MTMPPAAQSGNPPAGRIAVAEPEYRLASADLNGDAPTILARWRDGLNQQGMPQQKLDWYYRANIEGPPDVFFLHHSREHEVGVAAVSCRRMHCGPQTIRVGSLVDFVLHENHRTLFPALFMQKEMRRLALERHPILFGVPNKKSLVVVKRAGYRHVGDMVRRTRVLRSARYLSRFVPEAISSLVGPLADVVRTALLSTILWFHRDIVCDWQTLPDAQFDALWKRNATGELLIGVRDAAFLAWRFAKCPYHAYRFFTLRSREDGRLLAYAACWVNASHLNVDDFLIDASVPGLGTIFWRALAREAFRCGHIGLTVEFFGDATHQRHFAAAGLVVRGRHPVVATADVSLPGGLDAVRWYLTVADIDT